MPKIILAANTEWYLYNFRLSLARFLREQGYEVVLLSPPGKYAAALQEAGFRWLEWEVGRQTLAPWNELAAVLRLEQMYRRERPDLVHHHTIKPVLYGSLAARRAGVPAVVNSITGRGYVFTAENFKARLLRPFVRGLYRPALRFPNSAVIFENAADRQYFVETNLVPTAQTWLIEGVGVDAELFCPRPEPDGAPVALLAGRLLWDKGVGVMAEAARRLKTLAPDVRVALVGEPDPGNPGTLDETTLRGWVAEGIIEWRGFRSDMHNVYAESHIVAAPTTYGEGVPTTLLEAAACGRPIVASDTPGCRHVVMDGQNGLLVPPNDPEALAAAIARLAGDANLRAQMGAEGRKLVLEKFTTEKVNAATLEVYRTFLPDAEK